ncbi:MAG: aminoglycoside phosphotransferase family protein [Coriobacteriia bacterium]|nr:aminoglycoside phosphotransferase family protein [Coriobacteriia bacterium]
MNSFANISRETIQELLQYYMRGSKKIAKALGIDLSETYELRLAPFAEGEYNINLLLSLEKTHARWVVRLAKSSQMHLEQQITYEAHALELLETSARTPRLYFVDDTKEALPFGFLIEAYLDGRPLVYEKDLAQAAAILADVHSVPVPSARKLIAPPSQLKIIADECRAMFDLYRSWANADKALIAWVDERFIQVEALLAQEQREKHRSSQNETLHIVNTELNSNNFLINEGSQSFLVDWEKPLLGSVAQDLGAFLVVTTTLWKSDTVLQKEQRQEFLELYTSAVAGRFCCENIELKVNRFLALCSLRGITWCAMAFFQHESKLRPLQDDYTFLRVQKFISQEFCSNVYHDYWKSLI